MRISRNLAVAATLLAAVLVISGCGLGSSLRGSFDRTLTVTGPIRLELTNASGDIRITGGADGKVHVHGDARVSDFPFSDPQKRLNKLIANPPVEQSGDTIRVGRDLNTLGSASISYIIEVPKQTEVVATVASGGQTVTGVRGPVRMEAASGSIRVEHVEREAQLTTASGSVSASDIGNDVRVSSASGSVSVSKVKGDVRVNALAGTIDVKDPTGRVDVDTATGAIEVRGATTDVKAHAASGQISVQGNPSPNSYWDLKTASGSVNINVPAGASFYLTAEAVSGEIRAEIPIVIEEQGKHSVRARAGGGGARVEIHTVSGQILIQ